MKTKDIIIIVLLINILIIAAFINFKPKKAIVVDITKISNVTYTDIKYGNHLYEIKVWDGDKITYARHSVNCKCFKGQSWK